MRGPIVVVLLGLSCLAGAAAPDKPARFPLTSSAGLTALNVDVVPAKLHGKSALRVTMAGFLPPISTIVGRGQVRLKEWNRRIPTSYEPVKTMPSMPG